MPPQLSKTEVMNALDTLPDGQHASVRRIRYKNKKPLVQEAVIGVSELKEIIASAIEDEHLLGGDIEVDIPAKDAVLVGQHDGIFWLESRGCT